MSCLISITQGRVEGVNLQLVVVVLALPSLFEPFTVKLLATIVSERRSSGGFFLLFTTTMALSVQVRDPTPGLCSLLSMPTLLEYYRTGGITRRAWGPTESGRSYKHVQSPLQITTKENRQHLSFCALVT